MEIINKELFNLSNLKSSKIRPDNVPMLYPYKMSEDPWFSDFLRGYRIGTILVYFFSIYQRNFHYF